MRALNVFGFRIAGITAALLLILFGLYWGGKQLLRRDREPLPVSLSEEERARDRDNDGIADLYEGRFYATNPTVADTDGDGTADLQEITNGRNPTVAGENDYVKPPTGQQVATQDTYTQRYLAQLPAEVPREDILQQDRVRAFVDGQRGQLLPPIAPDTLKSTTKSGKTAISEYLDSISSTHNKALQAVSSADVEAAFRVLVNTSNPTPLQELVTKLEQNVVLLKAVPAPAEAAALHQKFVAASQALATNAKLLGTTNTDFVGALIGARNIEELGGVFQDIARQVKALEEKYGLQ
jgi:hypothetical protein